MGVDARLVVKFRNEPTTYEVKKIQYDLLRLFDDELFFWSYKKGDKREDFITKIDDGSYYFDTDTDVTDYWDINLTCRYYGPGYERGPGLEISAILLYLNAVPNIVEVRYGGDSSGTEGEVYDGNKSLQLLDYYLKNGHEPYQRFFTRKDTNVPNCSFCLQPMINYGGGGGKTFYTCQGCGEKKEVLR